jgi:hypothetical protein
MPLGKLSENSQCRLIVVAKKTGQGTEGEMKEKEKKRKK